MRSINKKYSLADAILHQNHKRNAGKSPIITSNRSLGGAATCPVHKRNLPAAKAVERCHEWAIVFVGLVTSQKVLSRYLGLSYDLQRTRYDRNEVIDYTILMLADGHYSYGQGPYEWRACVMSLCQYCCNVVWCCIRLLRWSLILDLIINDGIRFIW